MKNIKCNSCRLCNHKGKPSVSKGSQFCLQQRGIMPKHNNDSSWYMLMYHYLNGRTKKTGKGET